MASRIDWESQIGKRLRLRDLHVFLAVAQHGSMAKAAAHLGVSQPAVSEVVADLEFALDVKLLERGPHGVEPTNYGRTLLQRSITAFDELKQGVREIEFQKDPTAGELRIGSVESIASSILPSVILGFSQQYPRVVLNVDQIVTPTMELPRLRSRSLDLVLARISAVPREDDDINVEILFEDRVVVAAGAHSKWARRRKIDLAELANEPWALLPGESRNTRVLQETFKARGLPMPKACVLTFSVHLRANLLANGPFITAFPASVLRFYADRHALKALPVKLPPQSWPVAVVTLKNRTMNPVGRAFIDYFKRFTSTIDLSDSPVAKRSAAARP